MSLGPLPLAARSLRIFQLPRSIRTLLRLDPWLLSKSVLSNCVTNRPHYSRIFSLFLLLWCLTSRLFTFYTVELYKSEEMASTLFLQDPCEQLVHQSSTPLTILCFTSGVSVCLSTR
jgi:hypothetical protein